MYLTVLESNHKFMIKWFEEYSNLSSNQYSIFLNIINSVQNDLSVFYKMNDILDNGSGEFTFNDEKMFVTFKECNGTYELSSSFGSVTLDYFAFKTIISKIIDIYSETYPLGTVVDLNSFYFKDLLPIEDNDSIRVVIMNRFTPFTDELFFYYTGVIYPVGNNGTNISMVNFSPIAIEKVVHVGYKDEQDTQFVGIEKERLLIDMGMHSTAILTSEEISKVESSIVMREQ